MKKTNPKIVTEAILDDGRTFGKITINPISIYKYALLEKTQSPFLYADQDFSLENLAPSIFILANDRQTLKPYANDMEKLKEDSMDWLDENLDLKDLPKIIELAVDQFTTLNKAAPAAESADGKKIG